MSQRKELIIHIGSPKCGSTYLQRVMVANRSVLKRSGIHYPKPEGSHPGNGSAISEMSVDDVRRLLGVSSKLFLSHEDLFSMGPRMKNLPEICQALDLDLTILVFIRPFSEFIYGDYSQYLKQNIDRYISEKKAYEGQSFEEFVVNRRSQITPAGWLKSWQKLTDIPLNISHHRDIKTVLTSTLGVTDLKWEIEQSASNPSLRVSDCEEVAAAIDFGVSRTKVIEMYKLAYSKVGMADPGKTPDRKKWIDALFKQQDQSIYEEFGFNNGRSL